MKLQDVFWFIATNPSRWFSGLKLLVGAFLGRREITIRADGLRLICGIGRGEGVWCALRGLDYEPELRLFLSQLKPGDVVVDLGANIGAYAIRAAMAVGATGKVYAFEPLDRTRRRLERALELNNIGNVSVSGEAIGSECGYAQLAVKDRGSSASLAERSHAAETYNVRVTTLDEFADTNGISAINWVKMDIEGAEPLALAGMMQTISRFRPNFLFENESGGEESAKILGQMDYRIGILTSAGRFEETLKGPSLFAYPRERLPHS